MKITFNILEKDGIYDTIYYILVIILNQRW